MNWNKLKENKCPECSKTLQWWSNDTVHFYCDCGFKISGKKLKEIVASQINKSIGQEKHYRPEDENGGDI